MPKRSIKSTGRDAPTSGTSKKSNPTTCHEPTSTSEAFLANRSVAPASNSQTETTGIFGRYGQVSSVTVDPFAENVPALLTANGGSYFGGVLRDLAEAGYVVEWTVIGADDVGAPHRRRRLWIFANLPNARSEGIRWDRGDTSNLHGRDGQASQEMRERELCNSRVSQDGSVRDVAHTDPERQLQPEGVQRDERGRTRNGGSWWPRGWAIDPADVPNSTSKQTGLPGQSREREGVDRGCLFCGADQGPTPPVLGRVANGIPRRSHRLRCLGNAVVPQVVNWIGQRILDAEPL